MKKIISLITILFLFSILIFTGSTYAASLDTIDVQTSKTTIRPGEEIKVTINFGESLGAYTFDISYDDAIFQYVSVDGGTANDTGDKVKVTFYDTTGGSAPRTNMSIIFKAKSDITTSNPTEFTVTAEGLANADASVTFDDITTPIVKNVTVEPEYVDYTLKLEYTGEIIKGKEKEMKLSYSSPMGRYYEHARLIAEATTPTGATVKLLGTDNARLEHDIIQNGWGDAQGYKIGGKDVLQVLNVRGLFSDIGNYTITLNLIDRDNSDSIIAEKTFNFTVKEEQTTTPGVNTPENTEKPEQTTPPVQTETKKEETPTKLPKTGSNVYILISIILIALVSYCIYYNTKNK